MPDLPLKPQTETELGVLIQMQVRFAPGRITRPGTEEYYLKQHLQEQLLRALKIWRQFLMSLKLSQHTCSFWINKLEVQFLLRQH